MAMTPTHIPLVFHRLAELYSRERFELAVEEMTPPFPLGTISINGHFDRYFDPQTQAAWEGWLEGYRVARKFHSRLLQFQHLMDKCAVGLQEYRQ